MLSIFKIISSTIFDLVQLFFSFSLSRFRNNAHATVKRCAQHNIYFRYFPRWHRPHRAFLTTIAAARLSRHIFKRRCRCRILFPALTFIVRHRTTDKITMQIQMRLTLIIAWLNNYKGCFPQDRNYKYINNLHLLITRLHQPPNTSDK